MFDAQAALVLDGLQRRGWLESDRRAILLEEDRRTGRGAVTLALAAGLVRPAQVLAVVADELGLGVVDPAPERLDPELVPGLPAGLARGRQVVPWRTSGRSLEVLAADPFAPNLTAELALALQREVTVLLAEPAQVARLVDRYYADAAGPLLPGQARVAEVGAASESASVVRLVDTLLQRAIAERASDVHFEPFEQSFRVRCRIDGTLREVATPAVELAAPVISRLKVMAGLDIAERRVPQDGRIDYRDAGQPVDLRISTLPTQFGESVVLRVLDRRAVQLDLGQLGLPDGIGAELRQALRRPNGILIVTGPTGSGKTTTLYAALREIDRPERKLLTVEDPVEYEIDGVMQVPVNAAAGLTFPSVLRSFLRQDPDVLMVGEIRDLATAEIAIQAALTGHLVLTTLHTNDAPGAITRLMDLGIEPFLIASTVVGVLAQRLVRRVCPQCAREHEPAAHLLRRLGADADLLHGTTVRSGSGCPLCGSTGYHGRLGIFEWLQPSEALRTAIAQRLPVAALREEALRGGLVPLRRTGLAAARAGLTTVEEIVSGC